MATNYTGNATPTLNNAPASTWTDDAAKRSHVGNTYLVTGSGSTAGNVYAFEEYPSAVVKEVPASGLPTDIVTITDGGENLPMTSAEVSLSPQQDLNGYDYPWAGGAGVNILPPPVDGTYTGNGVTAVVEDGKITMTGTTTASGNAIIIPLSAVATVPVGSYIHFLNESVNANCSPSFELSTNISGTSFTGALSPTNKIQSTAKSEVVTWDRIRFWLANGVNASCVFSPMLCVDNTVRQFSPYSNICPITGHTGATLNIGAEYPTADRTYPASFGQTVYGGTFDWVSGKVVIEWAKYIFTGANIVGHYKEGTLWRITITGVDYGQNNNYMIGLCDRYIMQSNYAGVSNNNNSIGFNSSVSSQIIVHDDTISANNLRDLWNANPLEVVYPLATPIEIDLDPTEVETLQGLNNVWASDGQISALAYRSNQYVMAYDWFETWTMPKITRNNGNIIVLPYPQEYTPEIYDVDASTTGRNAAGTMIRDRVARKHKFNYKFPPLGQADATEILNAVQDTSFTLTTASPETGAKTSYRVYVGDRSLPVYWMPNHNKNSWLYETLSLNLIEM